ncbi:MAG: hypothetical protein Q8906_00460 [Bacillota bacterium]|nr:hypothetical protein [Bacillota bacterium]MDP4169043.1 hypothetical protein [Bacillota bacterium]
MIYILIPFALIVFSLYKRYVPIKNIPNVKLDDCHQDKSIVLLDIRDYNVAYKNQVKGAINLPFPYLTRNLNELPQKSIHLVVSNHLEKNLGIRLLNKKGYQVIGFSFLA